MNRVLNVSVSEVGMVRCFLVITGLLVFHRLFVMVGCLLKVTSRSTVSQYPSLGHGVLLCYLVSFWARLLPSRFGERNGRLLARFAQEKRESRAQAGFC